MQHTIVKSKIEIRYNRLDIKEYGKKSRNVTAKQKIKCKKSNENVWEEMENGLNM